MLKEIDRQNFKSYIKSHLQESIPGISFIGLPARNAPEINGIIVKASLILLKWFEKYILAEKNWEFTESFYGFDIPNSVTTLLSWIITDPKSKVASDCTEKQEADKLVQILSEKIMGVV